MLCQIHLHFAILYFNSEKEHFETKKNAFYFALKAFFLRKIFKS